MGLGPVFAIPKALKLAGLKLDDIDVFADYHSSEGDSIDTDWHW